MLGSVRPRDPDQHVQRLDLDRYRSWVARPAGRRRLRVAVIGAGMAGAAGAQVLAAHGHAVTVFEKSRGAGGRMATRRDDAGVWNYGAPGFDAVDARFRRQVADWRRRGLVRAPVGVHGVLRDGTFACEAAPRSSWCGAPAVNAPVRDLLDGLALTTGVRIAALQRDDDAWRLFDEVAQERGRADVVLVAVPPAQAAPLVAASAPLQARAAGAGMAACWSVRLRCAAPPGLPFDAARIVHPVLAACRSEPAAPARPGQSLHWVLHATAVWSAQQVEADPAQVLPALLDAWRSALGGLGAGLVIAHAEAHRWRYARPAAASGPEFAFDAERGLALAGDWLRGGGIEDAWLSGVAAAGAILRADAHA